MFPWWCFLLLDLLWEALLRGVGVGGELREAALMGKPGHTLTLVFFFNHRSLFLSNRPYSVKRFRVVFLHCYLWIILKLLLVECIISVDQPRCHCRLNLRARVLNKVVKWREGQVKECGLHSVHKRPLRRQKHEIWGYIYLCSNKFLATGLFKLLRVSTK